MGVTNLWDTLLSEGAGKASSAGAARSAGRLAHYVNAATASHAAIAEFEGKVLAIDTSLWMNQCSRQSELREAIYDEHARVLYIMLFRILSLLRYGATPVFVLEGNAPEAKRGRLAQRWGTAECGSRRGGRHDALGRKVVELLDLLGIPHVEAPGEAEALCAALVSAGLAGGAVTSDVDALLFGADTVYRECRLSFDSPQKNEWERVDASELAARCFGQTGGAGCANALQAVAVLSGCDYLVGGGRGVGPGSALEAVRFLTQGRQDDSHVLSALLRCLAEGPDPRVTALKACTGCKNCGHEKHGRRPCPECGPGPCKPKPAGAPCSCAFHRTEPERRFFRVIGKAAATGPDFPATCAAALAAFAEETRRARDVAEQLREHAGALSWSSRPDVRGVFSLLHPLLGRTSADPDKLLWTYGEVRDKLRPLLIEWDLRQGPQPTAAYACAEVEFRPRRIQAERPEEGRYLLEFERLPDVNPADSAFDTAQLVNSKLSKGRHVRQSLIRDAWPQLLQLREEEEKKQRAKAAPAKTRRGTGAAPSPVGSSLHACAASPGASPVVPPDHAVAAAPHNADSDRGTTCAGGTASFSAAVGSRSDRIRPVSRLHLHAAPWQAASNTPPVIGTWLPRTPRRPVPSRVMSLAAPPPLPQAPPPLPRRSFPTSTAVRMRPSHAVMRGVPLPFRLRTAVGLAAVVVTRFRV